MTDTKIYDEQVLHDAFHTIQDFLGMVIESIDVQADPLKVLDHVAVKFTHSDGEEGYARMNVSMAFDAMDGQDVIDSVAECEFHQWPPQSPEDMHSVNAYGGRAVETSNG